MIKCNTLVVLSSLALLTFSNSVISGQLPKNIEEMRVSKAGQTLPQVVNRYQAINDTLEVKLQSSTDELSVTEMAAQQGHRLWAASSKRCAIWLS
ncbi:hypothetical protein PEC18_30620 [Paucibacter sp. O1-1]|nr:hypothetical protein [Paucibacter sp. O1-1]MDA3830063.1 hypothetical protein [Paucibacter sp. O1-1]